MSSHFRSYAANLHRVRTVEFLDHQMMLERERRAKCVMADNRLNPVEDPRAEAAPQGLLTVPKANG